MPGRIIVLIGNDYFNDKKYSGPIVLDDFQKLVRQSIKLVDQN